MVAFVQLPLVAKNEGLGIITFFKKEEHEFTGEEIEFLSTLAGQAAMAISNAQLYERSTEQAVELEKASKLQADFSAMIVHDLRSPLSTDYQYRRNDGKRASWEISTMIKKIGPIASKTTRANLVGLVSDFLDLSKLEAGRIELVRTPTDITDCLVSRSKISGRWREARTLT